MLNIYKVILKSRVLLFVAVLIVITFVFSNEISDGIKRGFLLCFNVLIPSLFPFMTISSFIINFGVLKNFDKFFNPITKLLFNLPGCTAATIILGLVGGYPTGAVLVSNLLKNKSISEAQAERMMLFLVNAGPAFVITAIGARALHNANLGIVMFLSQTLAAILLGFITKLLFKDTFPTIDYNNKVDASRNFSDAFVKSVKDSSYNIFNMCAFVVLFSSFMEIIKNEMFLSYLKNLFNFIGIENDIGTSMVLSFFEVTTGCYSACKCKAPLGVLTFLLSFGGACVHLQIFSCVENLNFSKFKFILFRILHGLISIPVCYFLLPFFNQSLQTFNTFVNETVICDFTSSGLSIIFLCLCFLITLTSENINFKKE